ncbi:CXXX repeat peptide maturase [Bacteroides thetaiotaomicron]|uniref:CXXX repeat peptide maturase n=1 Tax=Bacteroides thetaiotaomicron TaxID=818 RepID=A0AA46U8T7_BACT4|nr:CXXX repeat peptide maturase [Bacteroides thetaiotaomicron]MDU8954706.1 CXXX repeat peptide maturase [Bacteroides sp.]MCS2242653.1 CXXX repeat peptide maturase [Bacteroides thetaiotaomicron]MCS2908044.1 CXXX repeat peptide maturase [Bacteroides thetaiotaomicron]MDC2094468.1 CXXX repeat peptide maturase [Bacteroides thetaiotaomicron]MDC2114446.1 CXXX repeat peptide maturase [Bacteroides thetaiotaomicron]
MIVLLDDTSVSYCHYSNAKTERKLIALSDLKEAVLFSMKRNLTIQFIYPDYALPPEYKDLIESVPHTKIASSSAIEKGIADIVVINNWQDLQDCSFDETTIYVWRTLKGDFFNHYNLIIGILEKVVRLNIIITDIETFDEEDFKAYQRVLNVISDSVEKIYNKKEVQLNLLTDRMMLEKMNNCNAGWESITFAPDGRFYICPAFYQEGLYSVGDLKSGLTIKNPLLYRLDHAPLCRNCDAYQCQRCIWLNNKTTLEVNTPSHEQCVVSHLERNASRTLLENIRQHRSFLPNQEIKEIDYLDPFDVRKEW